MRVVGSTMLDLKFGGMQEIRESKEVILRFQGPHDGINFIRNTRLTSRRAHWILKGDWRLGEEDVRSPAIARPPCGNRDEEAWKIKSIDSVRVQAVPTDEEAHGQMMTTRARSEY